jgi:hypothetical protein
LVVNCGVLQPLLLKAMRLTRRGVGSELVCNCGGLQPLLLTASMLTKGLTGPGWGSGLVCNCGGLQAALVAAGLAGRGVMPERTALVSSPSTLILVRRLRFIRDSLFSTVCLINPTSVA